MNESILKALMQLFAIVANVREDRSISQDARIIVESYLKNKLNQDLANEYLEFFNDSVRFYHRKFTKEDVSGRKRSSLNSVKILKICHQINEGLRQREKIIVLLRLIEFVNEDNIVTTKEIEFIHTVSETFNINDEELINIHSFVIDKIHEIKRKDHVLIINNIPDKKDDESNSMGAWFERNRPDSISTYKHIHRKNLNGEITCLFIESVHIFAFRYIGIDDLFLNVHQIIPRSIYILDHGSIIKGPRLQPVYYSDVVTKFLQSQTKEKIVFSAYNIEFRFKNSTNGIKPFSFQEASGQLIGIMGGSGVGKSTLLNVMNGEYPLNQGAIFINGYNLHTDKNKLEGIIGFIPQEELLIEELTVFQNLYFNAKLCFSNFSEKQLKETVLKLLIDLDLHDIRHLKVGNPLKKFISGGQRKRLNIALELLRQPYILFVDEPTSGLSSMDSEMVVLLLKEQTLKGKLVIANIHQPSSDIFKLFDKLLILDKGGYIIYYGNPIDAVVYFKTMSNYVNAAESECFTCGNVNPEQILQIVEEKMVDEFGKLTRNRKVTPEEWYTNYNEHLKPKIEKKTDYPPVESELPRISFRIPNLFQQFNIFFTRDVLSKLTNIQYLIINFLEAPVLAIILAFVTKYISGTPENPSAYIFSENENLLAYIFMSIIVALFLGLTVSAEEIIKDRKIRKRESFLNLSRFSYLNSKIAIMFMLSAIQTFSFVLIGNWMLEIRSMLFPYWLVLFSCSCFSNMVGLNISSGLNSVITIYILIPFILVPQILLGGVLVKFDKLHESISSKVHTPLIGDLMVSRWAFEALTVYQFKHNNYEKHFFDIEQDISKASIVQSNIIPRLKSQVDNCRNYLIENKNRAEIADNLRTIRNEVLILSQNTNLWFNQTDKLTVASFNPKVANQTKAYLNKLKNIYLTKKLEALNRRDEKYYELVKQIGKDGVIKLKQNNHNKQLADWMQNKYELTTLVEENNRLVQIKDPIFKTPQNPYGRAQFYAPVKNLSQHLIPTFWFNIVVIWLFSLVLYFTLLYDVLRHIINYIDKLRIRYDRD